ncbi:rod shape-determining protein MreC [Streptomyces litchfieldiae]|uniref:Cell shape-determining protein MreC n=1 Tax=Streptomyces litchfieldiae TaxID=3075543 RepID=A0ABU2MMC7_9ACTN|nr:rod shape-determining protein MreC [Streptomyces sp. DSM 44938]MDT0342754.1 rod shape-determining protein MreC [Streptomyces sp. DSM 44938]
MRDTRESRLLLVLLVCIAFALITMDIRGGEDSPLDGAREAAASVFGPVEEGVAGAVDPVANAIAAVRESGDRHDRISELERENAELRQQLGSEAHRDSRIEQLDEMLRTAGAGQYGIVGAQVIAIGAAQGFSWTVTIDAGSEDGIARDMTVLNGDGLVGRVTTVGPGTATVLLANDPGFTVGTRLEDSEELGFATGRGDNTLDVQLLNQQARVQEGDRMVTFGSAENRPFVPGVPVGEVVSVDRTTGDLTRTVQVRPYVAFTQLDLVGVVVEPPRDNPRDTVLPPRPEDEGRNESAERDVEEDADAGAAGDGEAEDDDPASRS